MSEAIIYTTPVCPFCVRAKALLKLKNVSVTEINAQEHKEAMIQKVLSATGTEPKTVPQIFLDGAYIGGFDKLVEHYKKNP